jgi:hypothetical protein
VASPTATAATTQGSSWRSRRSVTAASTNRTPAPSTSNALVVGVVVVVDSAGSHNLPPSTTSERDGHDVTTHVDHDDAGPLFPWLAAPSTATSSSSRPTPLSSSVVLFLDGQAPTLSSPSAILRISRPKKEQQPDEEERDTDKDEEKEDARTIEESLALLCDMILLVIVPPSSSVTSSPSRRVADPSSPLPSSGLPSQKRALGPIVAALVKGMEQRSKVPKSDGGTETTTLLHQGGGDAGGTLLDRGILLVAAPWADNATWVRHTVQTDLAGISPTQWRAMEVRTLHDLSDGAEELAQMMLFTTPDQASSSSAASPSSSTHPSSVLSALFPDVGTINNDDDSDAGNTKEELFACLLHAVIQSKEKGVVDRQLLPTVSLEYRTVAQSEETVPLGVIKASKEQNGIDGGMLPSSSTTTSTTTTGPEMETSSSGADANAHADVDGRIQEILTTAQRRLEALEAKMESLALQSTLQFTKAGDAALPILEFGTLAEQILRPTETQLNQMTLEGLVPYALYNALMQKVRNEVERLYKDHLQALRNYYGQRYESMIFSLGGGKQQGTGGSLADVERQRAEAAEYATNGFVAAARNAVPAIYGETTKTASGSNSGGRIEFDHVDSYRGLIQDMMEATQRLEDEQSLADMLMEDDDDDDVGWDGPAGTAASTRKRRRIPKWLERIAARVFVFGVNYIQGWLAWQGIKRAALDRDRNQPKFPLF